jgi:prolipoprotein diacylglyceryl transferase
LTTTILASFPSPPQGVWHLGPIPIRAYALFILIGVIAALIIGNKRWVARGGEPGVIYDIALWAIIFGLIGGRLYHVLTDWSTYFGPGGAGLVAAFKIQEGGLGIWGAVALGGVGAWIGCRRRGIPLPAFGDAIAPGIVLAQAIGRLGNYFNQELYGRATTVPWGLEIFERRDSHGALDSLNGVSTGQLLEVVHPTFLYELLWNLLVFAFLIWIDRRYRIGHGRLFALYVAAYCFGRFWVELMRSDMATHIAGIRINSFVSVFVFIGAVVYIMAAPKGREDPAALRGHDRAEEGAADEEVSPADAVTKELAAVAATTGVVAAAKAAGDKEDEDAAEAQSDVSEAEAEPVAEAEQLAEDVETAPIEDIAEAEAFAEAGEEAEASEETAPVGGVGAVEGEEATEAEEAAQDAHVAAVAGAEEAADVADQVAADVEGESGTADAEQPTESTVDEPAESPSEDDAVEAEADAPEVHEEAESATADAEQPTESAVDEPAESQSGDEAVGGVGAVEGDEVAEAEEVAPEVHEAAVENAEDAADAADDAAADADEHGADDDEVVADEQAEEPAEAAGAVGGVGAVEGDEVAEAKETAPEVHEAATENAEDAADAADDAAADADEHAAEASSGIVEAEVVEADTPESDHTDEGTAAEQAAPEIQEQAAEEADNAAATADAAAADSSLTSRLRQRWARRSRRS